MERISFDIFEPDGKKFHLTPDLIVFGLWAIVIGFFWALDPILHDYTILRTMCAIIVFLITMYYLIASFFTYKSLNGILKGKIIFENKSINIDNKIFEMKDISGLDFSFNDFYGKKPLRGYQSVNPMLSQGVNNYVTFSDSSGDTTTVYFKMLGEHSYLALSSFINDAIKMGKMTFKQGIDLLGIENVSINP